MDVPAPSAAGPYRGRFAPSPTGPLHFGSLVAAVGSYLEARRHGGQWLLRIEDLDRPREVPGATTGILRTLASLGMEWDGPVIHQSTRGDAYQAALARLEAAGAVYPCGCSRREIADSTLPGPAGPVYPGTCRNGLAPGRTPRALRVRVPAGPLRFHDGLQGPREQDLERDVGDFVVRRADGLFAYQLAVVVDDAEQGITAVVRGSDLLDSTPRQIHLQHLLGLPTPTYLHLPVAVNAAGEKLSKQTGAAAVDAARPAASLTAALAFLGQAPPADLAHVPLPELWAWALTHWRPERLPAVRTLAAAGNGDPPHHGNGTAGLG